MRLGCLVSIRAWDTSHLVFLAGFDVTDAKVVAVNGQLVQGQQLQLGAPAAAPDAAPKASNIPASRAAYAILGMDISSASAPLILRPFT